jgi:hypothetical protein
MEDSGKQQKHSNKIREDSLIIIFNKRILITEDKILTIRGNPKNLKTSEISRENKVNDRFSSVLIHK